MVSVFFRPYQDFVVAHGGDEAAALDWLSQSTVEGIAASPQLWQFRISQLREGKNSLWQKGEPTPLAKAMAKFWVRTAKKIFPPYYASSPEEFPAYWKSTPFDKAAAVTTKRREKIQALRNPFLSKDERLAILQVVYLKAPPKLLEAIALYGGFPKAFAGIIHQVEPCASLGLTVNAVARNLLLLLWGRYSGLDKGQNCYVVIQAAAKHTGWPLEGFVPVFNDDEQTRAILQERYPKAPPKLLDAIVLYGGSPKAFARLIQRVEPCASRGLTVNAVARNLFRLLGGSYSGWDKSRTSSVVIQAAENFLGWPLHDDDRLSDWREHYPLAPDALLQVIVLFISPRSFAQALMGCKPYKPSPDCFVAIGAELSGILNGARTGLGPRRKELGDDISLAKVIIATANLTGLDGRYFIPVESGGILLKSTQRIKCDENRRNFFIVDTGQAARPVQALVAGM
jgi:hypothetical protein